MLEIEFFAATVAGSSGSGFRSRYSAHCEGERWEGGGVREKDARGKRGRAPTLRGGESRTESRETHESGGGRRLLLRKTSRDAYLQKNRSERPARRGRKV